jgi:hypothetical protein
VSKGDNRKREIEKGGKIKIWKKIRIDLKGLIVERVASFETKFF